MNRIKEYFLKIKNRRGVFFWIWVGFFLSPFLIYGIWQIRDFLVNDGELVVAFSTALPPHHGFKEGERCSHGFDYSIAYFLAQRLRKNFKIKEVSFSEALKQLNTGTIDLICASMSITDERRADMAMVHVYGIPDAYMTLIFWNSSLYENLSFSGKDEVSVRKAKSILKDAPIGVLAGKVWPSVLKKYKFNNFKSYERENDMLVALELKEVVAVVISKLEANSLKKQNSNIQSLDIVLDAQWCHGAGIAIKKDRHDLIKNVSQTIKDLKNEGIVRQEQLRWFGRVCDE